MSLTDALASSYSVEECLLNSEVLHRALNTKILKYKKVESLCVNTCKQQPFTTRFLLVSE